MTARKSSSPTPSAMAPPPKMAMVLAAGLGVRMRPLTLTRPKPLIELGGRALIDHALDRLAEIGVETAVVNVHYLAGMLIAHLAKRTTPRIVISHEETLLETGGGIVRALPFLGVAPFYVVNADILWLDGPTPALARLAQSWDGERMDALLLAMATTRAIGYEGRGDFHMDPLGHLRRRRENEIVPFVYAGVQIIKPGLFAPERAECVEERAFSTNRVWDRASEDGRLYGLAHDGAWFHVGTPEGLAESEELLPDGGNRWLWP